MSIGLNPRGSSPYTKAPINLNPRYFFPYTRAALQYNSICRNPLNQHFHISDTKRGLNYLDGEVLELREAIEQKHSQEHKMEELGDVLLTTVNIGLSAGLDPNKAMIQSMKKIQNRLNFVQEEAPKNQNQFQIAWNKAKKSIG
jgi:NTP pyrophosphatase (non-canonical NTP hydrolase)